MKPSKIVATFGAVILTFAFVLGLVLRYQFNSDMGFQEKFFAQLGLVAIGIATVYQWKTAFQLYKQGAGIPKN